MKRTKFIGLCFLLSTCLAIGQDSDILLPPSPVNEVIVNTPEPVPAISNPSLSANRATKAPGFKGLPAIDIYGAIPINGRGAGMGFGMFSSPLQIGTPGTQSKLEMRLGGDFYFVQYDRKKLGTVPLLVPQTGDAKVTVSQYNYGINAVARFMLVSESAKLIPYADLFTGMRGFSTDMDITPTSKQVGYEASSSTNLSSATHWNYGLTLGLMYSVTTNIKLTTGIMYSSSPQQGLIDNVKGARVQEGIVFTDKMRTPNNVVILKFGLTVLVRSSESGNKDCCCECDCHHHHRSSGAFWALLASAGSMSQKSNAVRVNTRPSK